MNEPVSPLSPLSTLSGFSHATESHNPRVPAQIILDDIENRFGRAKTKHDVIRAMERCTYLHRIPLPPPNVALEQAEKDFCRERVLLNDVAFIPDRYDIDRSRAFALSLRLLLRRLSLSESTFDSALYNDANHICDLLMQRACRTSAGADSFFTVQKMLCVEGTFVTQKTLVDDPPIHIDVFLSQSHTQTSLSSEQTIQSPHGRDHQFSVSASDATTQSHADVRRRAHSNTLNPHIAFSSSHSPHIHSPAGRQAPSVSAPPVFRPLPEVSHLSASEGNISSASPSLCARIQVSNCFAIYDVSAMDLLGETETDDFFNDEDPGASNNNNTPSNSNRSESDQQRSSASNNRNKLSNRAPQPWLDVESVVVDESNFKTGRHWRRLHLLVTCPATGQTFSSDVRHKSSHHSLSHGRQGGVTVVASAPASPAPANFEEDGDFCDFEDLDDDLLYGPAGAGRQSRSHSGGRRVFRELAQWLAASSSAGFRLSSGQRSQQSQQTHNTQHTSSRLSLTPVNSVLNNPGSNVNHFPNVNPSNNCHNTFPSAEHSDASNDVDVGRLNVDQGVNNSSAAANILLNNEDEGGTNHHSAMSNNCDKVDIAHRGLPSLPEELFRVASTDN
jgi:hypothetical protein